MSGNIENNTDNAEKMEVEPKSLRELFSPISTSIPSCIILPKSTATHFELKSNIINLLPNFYGLDREDPYLHIKEFLDICSTFKFQNFTDDSVRLRLFPFSLKDKAKSWLNSLPTGSIKKWETLVQNSYPNFPYVKNKCVKERDNGLLPKR